MIGLRPAQKTSLAQHVLDQLLEQIRTGAVRPGDRIPSEHELMKIMNVGRSSVREALRGLIALGLLETSPGRGATVVGTPSDPLGALAPTRRSIESLQQTALLDLLEVRECLEAQAACLAAQRATAVDIVAIERKALDCERRVAQGRYAERANIEFHLAIARAAHNNVLLQALSQLIGRVGEFRARIARESPDISIPDITEHRAIAEAIRARAPEHAQRLVVEHIRGFAERVRQVKSRDVRPSP